MDKTRLFTWLAVALVVVAAFFYRRQLQPLESPGNETVNIDLVTGRPGEFYWSVISGAQEAAKEFNVNLRIHEPDLAGEDQKTIHTKLDPQDTNGVAVSPSMPAAQSRS